MNYKNHQLSHLSQGISLEQLLKLWKTWERKMKSLRTLSSGSLK